MGHSFPHISMHEGGIFHGRERRSLDIEEILVYPFDERARYLLVWGAACQSCPGLVNGVGGERGLRVGKNVNSRFTVSI